MEAQAVAGLLHVEQGDLLQEDKDGLHQGGPGAGGGPAPLKNLQEERGLDPTVAI